MSFKQRRKSGLYAPVVNIIICALLAVLLTIVLFGNKLAGFFPELNFSSFATYLPINNDGEVNGVIYYVLSNGWKIEPLAVILSVALFFCVVNIVMSIVSIVTRRSAGRRVFATLLALCVIGALVFFIFTYGMSFDGVLWKDINAFFTSIFTAGIMGGWMAPSVGAMAVFSTYLLMAGLGIASFFVSNVNK